MEQNGILAQMSRDRLFAFRDELAEQYRRFAARGLKLDMSRGKPSGAQLDLSIPLLHTLDDHDFLDSAGMDVRNYGSYTGIPEVKKLFGEMVDMPPEQVLVGGNSSINLIHDALHRAFINGPLAGDTPWCKLEKVKFICPAPGYDWHFHILDCFGIEAVAVPMLADGPDMDRVEELAQDPAVKGMICVPMYSNPTGVTFGDRVVERLAHMETAAPDFRLIWDNAYCMHHLYPEDRDRLANIYTACVAAGHADRPLLFTSTSKITFAGSGISCLAASPANIRRQSALLMYQLVCYDKMNQLRHARFLPDLAAVEAHMAQHAELLRPKFKLVLNALEQELAPLGIGQWRAPKGGYFICFYGPEGTAREIVRRCGEAGVTLTPAGAPFPGGKDPKDSVLRIAPTYPPLEELGEVMALFCIVAKLVAAEQALAR